MRAGSIVADAYITNEDDDTQQAIADFQQSAEADGFSFVYTGADGNEVELTAASFFFNDVSSCPPPAWHADEGVWHADEGASHGVSCSYSRSHRWYISLVATCLSPYDTILLPA